MRNLFRTVPIAAALGLVGAWNSAYSQAPLEQQEKASFPYEQPAQGDAKEKSEIDELRQKFEASKLKGLGVSADEVVAAGKAKINHREKEQSEVVEAMLKHLEAMKRALAERDSRLEGLAKQLAKLERDRALPPLENGQVKVLQLAHAKAFDAANTISSLFGAQAVRVAIDNRTNSLVIFGKDDSLAVVEALIQRLDSQAASDKSGKKIVEKTAESHRSVLLRLFWLADNIRDGGQNPEEYLPKSVLAATEKLGLNGPRLISQTVTSLSVGSKDAVEFASDVPAVIDGQPANLNSSGKIRLVDGGERAELQMRIQLNNPGVQCSVQGSLTTPLGHYMVLGTANTLTADDATMQAMAFQQGGMVPGPAGGFTRGRMAGGMPGGRVVPGREFSGPPGAGPEEAGEVPAGEPPASPKFETSRFAFVVQVVNAGSYSDDRAQTPNAKQPK